jgi:hypothetical protein
MQPDAKKTVQRHVTFLGLVCRSNIRNKNFSLIP